MMGLSPAISDKDDFESGVLDYLRGHPDFFARHPELLSALHLGHDSGPAVSLVERQVRTLREQNDDYRRRIAELIEVAQQNEGLQQRLHRLSMALLEVLCTPADPERLRHRLRIEFEVESVELRLFPDNDPGDYRELVSGPPRCGRLAGEQLRLVFGILAERIRSCALVPLNGAGFCGLLAFGSEDEHRFQPGLGTDYLLRLGELVTKALEVAPIVA